MSKMVRCAEVDPSSGCKQELRGETTDELFQKVAEHAKEHGIRQVTPELIEQVKLHIHDV